MFKKITATLFLGFALTFAAPAPAHAGLLLKLFKMALSSTPGLPVFEYVGLAPVIGQIPPTLIHKVQEEAKTFAQDMMAQAKSGNINFSNPQEALKSFKIKPKSVDFKSFMPSPDDLKDPSGYEVTDNPHDIGSQVEQDLLVSNVSSTSSRKQAKEQQRAFLRKNALEASAFAATMQARLNELPDELDAIKQDNAVAKEDENKAWRSAFAARHTFSTMLSLYNQVLAKRLQLAAAQKIATTRPKKTQIAYATPTWEENSPTQFASLLAKPALAATTGGLSFGPSASAAQPLPDESLAAFTDVEYTRSFVDDALDVHNILYSLIGNKSTIDGYLDIINEHKRTEYLLSSNEGCNQTLLKPYFRDHDAVWLRLSTFALDASEAAMIAAQDEGNWFGTYEEEKAGGNEIELGANRKKGVTIKGEGEEEENPDEHMAENGTECDLEEMDDCSLEAGQKDLAAATGEESDLSYGDPPIDMDETEKLMRVDWEVGRAILEHLYANQDDWGKRKKRFPLWKDQITMYQKKLEKIYTPIQMYYKAYHNMDVPAMLDLNFNNMALYYPEGYPYIRAAHDKHIDDLPVSPTATPTYHCNVTLPVSPSMPGADLWAMRPKPKPATSMTDIKTCYPEPSLVSYDLSGNEVGIQNAYGIVMDRYNDKVAIGISIKDPVVKSDGSILGQVVQGEDRYDDFKQVVVNGSGDVVGYIDGTRVRKKTGTLMPTRVPRVNASTGAVLKDVEGNTLTTPTLQSNGTVYIGNDKTVFGTTRSRGKAIVGTGSQNMAAYFVGSKIFSANNHNRIYASAQYGQKVMDEDKKIVGELAPLNVDAPPPPPQPLPYWKEYVYMMSMDDNFYPEIPEPWQEALYLPTYTSYSVEGVLDEQFDNRFRDRRTIKKLKKADVLSLSTGLDPDMIPPDGELEHLITFVGFGKKQDNYYFYIDDNKLPMNMNRISTFLKLYRNEEDLRPKREEAEASLESVKRKIDDLLSRYNRDAAGNPVGLKPTFSFSKPMDYVDVIAKIKKIKTQKIKDAERALAELRADQKGANVPLVKERISELEDMIMALEADKIGLLSLSYQEAKDVHKKLKTAKADSDLLNGYRDEGKEYKDSLEDEDGCPIF